MDGIILFTVRFVPYLALVVWIFLYFGLRSRCRAALTLMKSYCLERQVDGCFSADSCFFYVMFMTERTGRDFYIEYADGCVYLRDMRMRRRVKVSKAHVASLFYYLGKYYKGEFEGEMEEGFRRWRMPERSSIPDEIFSETERSDLVLLMQEAD